MQNLQKSGTEMKSILRIPPCESTSSSPSSSSPSIVSGDVSSSLKNRADFGRRERANGEKSGDCRVACARGDCAAAVREIFTDVRPTALNAQLQEKKVATVHSNSSNLVLLWDVMVNCRNCGLEMGDMPS